MGVHGGFVDGPGVGGGFHEEDHPRDEHGRFEGTGGGDESSGGGGGKGEGGKVKPAARSLSRPGFHAATDEERKQHKIPPGWADVHVADDPKARLVVVGRDSKGRQQSRYSVAHSQGALVEKHERGRMLNAALPGILYHVDREIREGGKGKESAAAIRLIAHTGARIGSDRDTGAEEKAYGASTLEARHVTIEGENAHLDFIGKKGVRNRYTVTDPAIVADLSARKAAASAETDRLFDTNDDKIRDYLKEAAGGQEFKVHDLRTWKATSTARIAAGGMEPPTNPEEYWKRRDEVGQVAARQINDTLQVALKTYVDPIVFEDWRTRAGVAENAERPKSRKSRSGDS